MAKYAVAKNVFTLDTDLLTTGIAGIGIAMGNIHTFDVSFEDQLQTNYFLGNGGFASNDISAMDMTLTFTGVRDDEDAVQIAIATVILDVEKRKTVIEWTPGAGSVVFTIPCVITDIVIGGGSGGDLDEFSFTARLDGEPTFV